LSVARPAAAGTPVVRWNRLGDIGLFALFSLVALGPIIKTYQALEDGSPLLALHYALSGTATLIMAALLLIRREAFLKATQRREQLAAVVGTFTIIPLGLLSLTWQADWLLEATSVGFVVAYGWIVWSLLTLRRSFSIFPEARGLITHGPYGLVRHPLYAAYFLTYTLVMIPRFGLPAVLLTALGIGAEVLRSRNEERLLRVAFPDYDDYAATVRAFIPIKRRAAG
jgi:protein-S-isoprenylcysteine O-methyltransferase Ste14